MLPAAQVDHTGKTVTSSFAIWWPVPSGSSRHPPHLRTSVLIHGATGSDSDIDMIPMERFAALRIEEPVERIGGGYETDVFVTGDRRYVLKLKLLRRSPAQALAYARKLRAAGRRFQSYLGAHHSVPSDYLLVAGPDRRSYVLAVQPYLDGARPLGDRERTAEHMHTQQELARQLGAIVDSALLCFRHTGSLPDLYGLDPQSATDARGWRPSWPLRALWRLVAGRPLLASHNLMLTPTGRVVLVDYDLVCVGWVCFLVYLARAVLLWRDRHHIADMARQHAANGPS